MFLLLSQNLINENRYQQFKNSHIMKKSILHFLTVSMFMTLFISEGYSQIMLDSVFVEKYHKATVADNALDANLPVGSVTYRIYIDMKPGYRLQSVYGVKNH